MKPYYSEAGIEIYHGDCRQILPQIGKFDLLLTDPPYGIQMSKGFEGFEGFEGFGGFGAPIARKQYPDMWDDERPHPEVFQELLAICDKAVIWGGNFFADLLPQSTHWYVWDKLNTMPTFGDCELAWTNVDRKSVKKVTIQWNGLLGKEDFRDHPTQKPLKLMKWCLAAFPECKTVLDPFMGSGTTLVAAKSAGMSAVGIELQEKYAEIAANRLRQEVLAFA